MIDKLQSLTHLIGKTPVKKLDLASAQVYVKLEYNNYSGSIKDRAALKIITEGVRSGRITPDTTIVESSSGNFAIALASICRMLGVKFIAVIDPNINRSYEELLSLICYRVVKVSVRDETGGYLLTRIETVKEICSQNPNCFWTNQYENPDNYRSYYETLGVELCQQIQKIDYLFVGVSSCGTITGLSKRFKEQSPETVIVGVDVEGSVIFNQVPKKRNITGIGASKVPSILLESTIDRIAIISEENIIDGCHQLLAEQTVFGGASAGASYFAIKDWINRKIISTDSTIVFLCPDRGNAYMDTVYNQAWCSQIKSQSVYSSSNVSVA
jgi:2,3-diaminopropionate biosynthesis protein SbnA